LKFVVDENVSFSVVRELKAKGHNVISIIEKGYRGLKNSEVFFLAVKERAIIITRDHHFTNPFKYPSEKTKGIIYIRYGNLTSEKEACLVLNFIKKHDLKEIDGSIVILSKETLKIRYPRKR